MSQLLRSVFTVGSMTAISRVFGLLRDIIITRLFGASAGLDVFIVVFRIPNFLRRLFAEGGFSQAFVPVLTEYKEQRDKADVQDLVGQTAATLGLVLFVITLLGVLLSPILLFIFAPGFINDVEKYDLGSQLLKITFPYLLFISLTAFASGILNTYNKFTVPALTPVLLNFSLIACAIWLAPHMDTPVMALAWGVFIAGIVQLLFQVPFLFRIGMFPKPGFNRDLDGIKRIWVLMLPILFAVSIVQLNLLIDTVIASFLATGSISWLYFSDRLIEFPIGVFGIALSTVILPNLSKKYARHSVDSFSNTLDWALRWVFLIALPAAVGLIVLAAPLLTTLFQYQEFTTNDVLMAKQSLMAYAIGLPAFILIKVLASGFFSRQDTKTPVKIGVVAVVANLVMNLLLVGPLAHAGLALATSLSACLQSFLLFWVLRQNGIYRSRDGWISFMPKLLIAIVIMGSLINLSMDGIEHWFVWNGIERVWHLALLIMTGLITYFVVLFIFGLRLRDMVFPASSV